MIVVDASVIFKWIIHEADDGAHEALRLREQLAVGEIDVAAPDILLYEISNVLTHTSRLTLREAKKAWRNFFLFDITFVSTTKETANEYFSLSQQYGISTYDAAYVALAKTRNIRLVTADKKLVSRVQLPFIHCLV